MKGFGNDKLHLCKVGKMRLMGMMAYGQSKYKGESELEKRE